MAAKKKRSPPKNTSALLAAKRAQARGEKGKLVYSGPNTPLWLRLKENGKIANWGRPDRFKTPEALLKEACAYFEWLENNPYHEEKVFAYEGEVITHDSPRMRVATLEGLRLFLGISCGVWEKYRKDMGDSFKVATEVISEAIREQKLTGAAAGLLNATIISLDLRLRGAEAEADEETEFVFRVVRPKPPSVDG